MPYIPFLYKFVQRVSYIKTLKDILAAILVPDIATVAICCPLLATDCGCSDQAWNITPPNHQLCNCWGEIRFSLECLSIRLLGKNCPRFEQASIRAGAQRILLLGIFHIRHISSSKQGSC